MELFVRMVSLAAGAVILGLALWFSLTLFAVLFLLGIGTAMLFWLRQFLVAREILNPNPGVPPADHPPHTQVIEVEYERVDERKE